MENTNLDLISEEAEYIYREIGEGYGFNGPEELALSIIQKKLDEYANDQTTQLREDNEKLMESLKLLLKQIKLQKRFQVSFNEINPIEEAEQLLKEIEQ